jgi:hypothetical protein
MAASPIGVKGLKEFQRSIKKLDSDLPKALRIGLNGAADLIITKARPLIPKRTGKAAASLKAKSTQKAVRIGVGGRSAPYYPWLDFGGKTGKGKSVHRSFYSEGRYLYPTLRQNRPEITALLQGAILSVAKDAGLDVN